MENRAQSLNMPEELSDQYPPDGLRARLGEEDKGDDGHDQEDAGCLHGLVLAAIRYGHYQV